MATEDYIGTIVKTEDNRSFHITGVLGEGGQGVVLKTQEGFLIKINTSVDKEKYRERYKWLIRKSRQLSEQTRIAFPIAILAEPNVGYVMLEVPQGESMETYTDKPEEIDDFVDWYFNASGGLERRLSIGYLLAKSMRFLHIGGCAYVDLSPKNVLVVKGKNSLALIDSDNITSGTYKPLIKGTDFYIAPEISLGIGTVNTLSDTYAYAVLLFKILTSCHPFIGDDAEDANPEMVCNQVNNGELDYIGDPNSYNNKNSIFEETQIFLSEELKELFLRMFVGGKLNPEKRPTLLEFMKALKHARYQLVKCTTSGCDIEYYYSRNCTCSECGKAPKKVFEITSRQMVRSEKKILLPIKKSNSMDAVFAGREDGENTIYITSKNKTITSSFFDEGISLEDEKSMFSFVPDKSGKLLVANHCNKNFIVTDSDVKKKRELKTYIKGKTEPLVIDEDSMIFLNPNMDLQLEIEAIDMSQLEKFYGKTEIHRFLTISEA